MYRTRSERKRIKRNKIIFSLIILAVIILYFVYSHHSRQTYNNRYDKIILQAAKRNSLDPNLIKALIWQESRFNDKATGKKGEIGLMQIMPDYSVKEWAKYYNRTIPNRGMLFRPVINIGIGSWYLAKCKRRWYRYKYALDLALAEYNAGYSNVKQWAPKNYEEKVLPNITFPTTKQYIKAIVQKYNEYKNSDLFKK